MTALHTIATADCQDLAIREAARLAGLASVDLIATNGLTGDRCVDVYRVGDVLAIATNGNPIWQEDDAQAFADLLDEAGMSALLDEAE